MRREQKFNTFFNKWWKENLHHTAAFELKVTTKNSIPFSVVKEHQIQALWHAKHDQIMWKIMDCGYQNVFDAFCLSHTKAYVVILYPSKKFYIIDINDFIQERNSSTRKSLTEAQAHNIKTYGGKI